MRSIGAIGVCLFTATALAADDVRTGPAAYGDWRTDAPGVRRLITPADMPPPNATGSVANPSRRAPRTPAVAPRAPPGFSVDLFAQGLSAPRVVRTAPNGDIFVAESGAGRVLVFRADGTAPRRSDAQVRHRSAARVRHRLLSVGRRSALGLCRDTRLGAALCLQQWRFEARPESSCATCRAAARTGPAISPSRPTAGRCSSRSARRPTTPTTSGRRARRISPGAARDDARRGARPRRRSGLRSRRRPSARLCDWPTQLFGPDGAAVDRRSLVRGQRARRAGRQSSPDYATHIVEGAFYGWPWYYIGEHEDPRHKGERPDLPRAPCPTSCSSRIQPRSASLSTRAMRSRPSIKAMPLSPSTARGTAPGAPATRSCASS